MEKLVVNIAVISGQNICTVIKDIDGTRETKRVKLSDENVDAIMTIIENNG